MSNSSPFPVEYRLYYPDLVGESGPELGLTMLFAYDDALSQALGDDEAKEIVETFMHGDEKLGEQALVAFEAAVAQAKPCTVEIDKHVTFVLTDDLDFYLGVAADILASVDRISVQPEDQE